MYLAESGADRHSNLNPPNLGYVQDNTLQPGLLTSKEQPLDSSGLWMLDLDSKHLELDLSQLSFANIFICSCN